MCILVHFSLELVSRFKSGKGGMVAVKHSCVVLVVVRRVVGWWGWRFWLLGAGWSVEFGFVFYWVRVSFFFSSTSESVWLSLIQEPS